jgi:anti-sigma factor RsiW
MKCLKPEKLTAYAAGVLPAAEQAQVTEHLAQCPACQAEWVREQQLTDLLGKFSEVRPPANVWPKVQARLTPRRKSALLWRRVAQAAPVFTVCLIVLVAVAVVFVLPHLGSPVGQPALSGTDLDGAMQAQISANWDSPLADNAALGLAMIALPDKATPQEAVN